MRHPEDVGITPDATARRRGRRDHRFVAIACAAAIASAACSALLGLDPVPALDEPPDGGSVDAAIDGEPGRVDDAGVIYAVTGRTFRGLGALYRWDPSTPNVAPTKITTIGCLEGGAPLDIAISGEGRLYATTPGLLVELDPADGSCARAQPLSPSYWVYGLAFAPAAGGGEVLVGCGGKATDAGTEPPNKCLRIDPMSGAVTETGTFSADTGGSFFCLGDVVVIGASTFVNVTKSDEVAEQWGELDIETCQLKSVGPLGVAGASGLAHAGNQLYAFTRDGTIFAVDPTSARATALVSPPLDWAGATSARPASPR
jgi:hypothetical protein